MQCRVIFSPESAAVDAVSVLVVVFAALTASSGHDALEQMELYVPEILMTDVVMPDMTGLDLIKTVHANYPHNKILMISGYSDFEYIHTAMLHGGTLITLPL